MRKKYEIRFEDVTFKYINDDTVLFENLNFKFNKNEHIIITGPNGSGKSTLLGLMFFISGKVFSNSNRMGYIGPVPLIFTDSLKNNVMYGNDKNINDENIIEKLKLLILLKKKKIMI